MAFEQSQKTRVESKQYSGDWAGFIAPQGNGGHATEPYYSESVGIDLKPIATSIDSVGDTIVRSAEANRKAQEKEEKRLQDVGGAELLEDLRKINESTPEGSKREELVKKRIARGIRELGLNYHDVQNLRSYSVNDYAHSYQSMLEEATKKANVESRQNLAKLADEVRPEMIGRPFDERVKAGQDIAKSRDQMQFDITIMSDPRATAEQRQAAGMRIAPKTFTQMSDEDVRSFFANPTQWGEKQTDIMASALAEASMNEGVDYRTAKYNASIIANHMYKIAHQQEDDLNKLILDEQKQQIDRMTNMSRMAVFEDYINAQPQYTDGMSDAEKKAEDEKARRRRGQGVTIALMGMDPTKDPSVMADIWSNPPDVDRFKLQEGVRRWNGQFDYATAQFGFKYGNPNTVNASFEGMYQEATRRNTPEGYTQLGDAMMSPQMKDILLRVSPEAVEIATTNIMAGEKEIIESQIRDFVRATTAAKDGRAVGYSVFDSSDKINEVMDASRARMDNVGLPADKREEVIAEVFKDFGLDFGKMSYSPDELYQYAEQKFKEYGQKHWFRSFFNEFADAARDPTMNSLGSMAAKRTYAEWRNGDITGDEAVRRLFVGLKDLPDDIVPKTKEGAPIVPQRSAEDEVASSPEFMSMMENIAADQTIPQDKKPEVARSKFMEMVQELVGVKSANAAENKQQPTKEDPYKAHVEQNVQSQTAKNIANYLSDKVCTVTRRSPEVEACARTIFGEARRMGSGGVEQMKDNMRNVASVIQNRRAEFNSWEDVCLSKGAFSCWNKNDPNYKKLTAVNPYGNNSIDKVAWEAALEIAQEMIDGNLSDTTGGAMFYMTKSKPKSKYVGNKRAPVMSDSFHVFYDRDDTGRKPVLNKK